MMAMTTSNSMRVNPERRQRAGWGMEQAGTGRRETENSSHVDTEIQSQHPNFSRRRSESKGNGPKKSVFPTAVPD
jgi:hypothetical protein